MLNIFCFCNRQKELHCGILIFTFENIYAMFNAAWNFHIKSFEIWNSNNFNFNKVFWLLMLIKIDAWKIFVKFMYFCKQKSFVKMAIKLKNMIGWNNAGCSACSFVRFFCVFPGLRMFLHEIYGYNIKYINEIHWYAFFGRRFSFLSLQKHYDMMNMPLFDFVCSLQTRKKLHDAHWYK